MQNNLASETSKPSPIPGSFASHAPPVQASARTSAQWINLSVTLPDLSITDWMMRLLKFEIGALLTGVILALPLLALSAIVIAIAAVIKH